MGSGLAFGTAGAAQGAQSSPWGAARDSPSRTRCRTVAGWSGEPLLRGMGTLRDHYKLLGSELSEPALSYVLVSWLRGGCETQPCPGVHFVYLARAPRVLQSEPKYPFPTIHEQICLSSKVIRLRCKWEEKQQARGLIPLGNQIQRGREDFQGFSERSHTRLQ